LNEQFFSFQNPVPAKMIHGNGEGFNQQGPIRRPGP
jgi:hypothetical protein